MLGLVCTNKSQVLLFAMTALPSLPLVLGTSDSSAAAAGSATSRGGLPPVSSIAAIPLLPSRWPEQLSHRLS